jgi:anti-sigma B factor antagonist
MGYFCSGGEQRCSPICRDARGVTGRHLNMTASTEHGRLDFTVGVEKLAGLDIVTPAGELDVFTMVRLRSVVFDQTLCSQDVLLLDLSEVDFIDSTGLGLLVATRRWTYARSARLVLVVTPGSLVARILAIAGLTGIFTTLASRDPAAALLGAAGP